MGSVGAVAIYAFGGRRKNIAIEHTEDSEKTSPFVKNFLDRIYGMNMIKSSNG